MNKTPPVSSFGVAPKQVRVTGGVGETIGELKVVVTRGCSVPPCGAENIRGTSRKAWKGANWTPLWATRASY